MFEEGVCRKNGVVGLYYGSGDLWGGVDREPKLRLLSIINGESLQQK